MRSQAPEKKGEKSLRSLLHYFPAERDELGNKKRPSSRSVISSLERADVTARPECEIRKADRRITIEQHPHHHHQLLSCLLPARERFQSSLLATMELCIGKLHFVSVN